MPTAGSFLGAETLLGTSDFTAGDDGWGTGELEGARIHAQDGWLRFDLTRPQHGFWSPRRLGSSWSTVRATGVLTPAPGGTGGSGYFGFLCGTDDDDFYAGLFGTERGTVLIRVVAGEVGVLTSTDDDLGIEPGRTVATSFECAGGPGRSLQLVLWASGRQAATYVAPESPLPFATIGVYAEGISPTFSVVLDEASAYGGGPPVGASPSPASPAPARPRGASPSPTARP